MSHLWANKDLLDFGIVTVLFKSDSVIDGFVDALNKQEFINFEVIFIENDVESYFCEDFIKRNAKFNYKFLRNESNVGVAKANNQGIDYFLSNSSCTHVLFLNNDIEVLPSFLDKQADMLVCYPEIQALAPKMFYHNSGGKVWYAGGTISYLKGNCRHFGHNKKDKLIYRDIYAVDYAPTCSLLIEARVLRQTGIRMWEELFVYYDDTVFCDELSKAGVRMYYSPLIHLQHKISSSTGGSLSNFSRYYLTRNWLYWGIRKRNVAVFIVAVFKYLYYLGLNKDIEVKAMKDAFSMVHLKN